MTNTLQVPGAFDELTSQFHSWYLALHQSLESIFFFPPRGKLIAICLDRRLTPAKLDFTEGLKWKKQTEIPEAKFECGGT